MHTGESSEFKAFTRGELAALNDNDIPPNVREIALLILDSYLGSWKRIEAISV